MDNGDILGIIPDWWHDNRVTNYAKHISKKCGIQVGIVRGFDHEPKVLNWAIDVVLSAKARYLWFLHLDDEIIYPETPLELAQFMKKHPDVGVACPNREGEPRGHKQPFYHYLADNTCIMYDTKIGARFDEDFIFTGWNDLDFGETVQSLGFKVAVYGLLSVNKSPTPYASWSSFRRAYNARNRILLEAKWWWIGRENWKDVDYYNKFQAGKNKKIPNMFELAWWSEDRQNAFADSVYHEHPQILVRDGQESGNTNWEWE